MCVCVFRVHQSIKEEEEPANGRDAVHGKRVQLRGGVDNKRLIFARFMLRWTGMHGYFTLLNQLKLESHVIVNMVDGQGA